MQHIYRVYDKKNRRWIHDNIYLSPNNDLILVKPWWFWKCAFKISLLCVSDTQYVVHRALGLQDIDGKNIFEGDICRSTTGNIGLIVYVPQYAIYVFLDLKENKYIQLDEEECSSYLEIIGNVFDTPDLISDAEEKIKELTADNID